MSDTEERARICMAEIQDILEKFKCTLTVEPQVRVGPDGDIRVQAQLIIAPAEEEEEA